MHFNKRFFEKKRSKKILNKCKNQEKATTKLRRNSRRKYKHIMLNGYEKDIFIKHQAFTYFSAILLFNIIEMFIIQQIINIS